MRLEDFLVDFNHNQFESFLIDIENLQEAVALVLKTNCVLSSYAALASKTSARVKF